MGEEILKRAERFNKEAASDSGYSDKGVFKREIEREYVEDIFKNIPKKRYVVYGVLIGIATISLGFIFKKNCSNYIADWSKKEQDRFCERCSIAYNVYKDSLSRRDYFLEQLHLPESS